MNKEHFFQPGEVECRSGGEGKPTIVRGYAAVFGKESRVLTTNSGHKFVETISAGAFDGADMSDLVAAFDHRNVLAKYPESLKVGTDSTGLWYEYEHDPADPDHQSVMAKIRRGVVKGSSFMFDLEEDGFTVEKRGNMAYRMVTKISVLYDVGPVVRPAYLDTTALARSVDAVFGTEKEENLLGLRLRVFLAQFPHSKKG